MAKLPHGQHERKRKVDPTANAVIAYMCELSRMADQRHYIKEWRKFRGMTQEQLAARIGIDKSYLSKIENGKKRYDQPFLEAAGDVLRCTPRDLVGRDPSAAAEVDPWDVWQDLTPTARRQWIEIGKTLKVGSDH